jgi:hypothetical protein
VECRALPRKDRREEDAMPDQDVQDQPEAPDPVPEDTGNYPDPDDGAQDEVDQEQLPQFDADLVDGAHLEAES